MSEEEMILDYPRLKLEYTRLHEDYRRLQSKLKAVENGNIDLNIELDLLRGELKAVEESLMSDEEIKELCTHRNQLNGDVAYGITIQVERTKKAIG